VQGFISSYGYRAERWFGRHGTKAVFFGPR
jgi:hypothetical protein